jgi:hypothetical protein
MHLSLPRFSAVVATSFEFIEAQWLVLLIQFIRYHLKIFIHEYLHGDIQFLPQGYPISSSAFHTENEPFGSFDPDQQFSVILRLTSSVSPNVTPVFPYLTHSATSAGRLLAISLRVVGV